MIKLMHYVTTNKSTDCSLKNCSVVIDGHNFLFDTYEESKLPFVFGCEANEYAKYLKNHFEMFKKANIKCYIVFKGGDTDMKTKMNKVDRRIFDIESNYIYLQPVFANEVYKQVLDEMDIIYTVCTAEAREECVALAHELGCPIISHDTEYCFKGAPYISYKTLKYDNATHSILCRQYKLQDFLHDNLLTEKKMAVFALLIDPRHFSRIKLDSLLITWCVSDKNIYTQARKLILWLSKNKEDKIKEDIDKALSSDEDRNKFWHNVEKYLKCMRQNPPGIAGKYLINSELTVSRQDPMWFEKGVATKTIPIPYINLYKFNIIQGSCALENKSSEDSVLVSIDIIKYAYNLMTNFQKDTITLWCKASPNHPFILINTAEGNITKPNYSCKDSVFENGWSEIKHLKLFEHFLNANHINTDLLNQLPVDATVLFAALVYFTHQKRSKEVVVTKEVYAVLVSYVLLNVLFDTEDSHMKTKHAIKKLDCQQVINATKEYFMCGEMEARKILDGNLAKSLVELQYCLLHMNFLNTLCGSRYEATKYSRTFNATFVYKMFYEMQEQDADDFINNVFIGAPSVLKLINYLIKTYQQLLLVC